MNVCKMPLTKRSNLMLNIEYMINHYQIPSRGLTKNVIVKEGFITSPKEFIKKEIH